MENLVGKYAYKTRGLFAGLVGKIEKSDDGITPYKLVYKNWSAVGFTSKDEILLHEGELNEG